MQANWLLKRGNKVLGPLDDSKLRSLMAAGKLLATDEVSADNGLSWAKLAEAKRRGMFADTGASILKAGEVAESHERSTSADGVALPQIHVRSVTRSRPRDVPLDKSANRRRLHPVSIFLVVEALIAIVGLLTYPSGFGDSVLGNDRTYVATRQTMHGLWAMASMGIAAIIMLLGFAIGRARKQKRQK